MSTGSDPDLAGFPDLSRFPSPVAEWYYNIRTRRVEPGRLSPVNERMGPYPTRAAAEAALADAANRNENWELDQETWDAWNKDD